MKIGLVPGSFKPYHAGHDALIRLAAQQNDKVIVFSSNIDRARRGELAIDGSKMKIIMKDFIKPMLLQLGNVEVIDVGEGSTPVKEVFDILKSAEKNGSTDTYTIHSDSADVLKYTSEKLRKYAPSLFANRQITPIGVVRGVDTPDISGTKMREYLKSGNAAKFIEMLPDQLKRNGKKIITILREKK